jgi:hypothetical protein
VFLITQAELRKYMVSTAHSQLKVEVEQLAAQAFYQHLISGYGNGENPDEYQIVIDGKPRHFPLEYARTFLLQLVAAERTAALLR